MNPFKKVMSYTWKGFNAVYWPVFLHCAGMAMTQVALDVQSPKITNESQLEQVIAEERMKIDPQNDYTIMGDLVDEDEGCAYWCGYDLYGISIGGSHANVTTVRHELYHILDDHLVESDGPTASFPDLLMYLFWHEPQATIYQATGIKL